MRHRHQYHTTDDLVKVIDLLETNDVVSNALISDELGGRNDDNISYLIYELRRIQGYVVQNEPGVGYYLSRQEMGLEVGVWVKTPRGVGLIRWARDGFPKVSVIMAGEVVEQFDRADLSTIGKEKTHGLLRV